MPAIKRRALRAARIRSATVTLGVLLTLCLTAACLQRYEVSTLEIELAAVRGWMSGDGLYAYRVPGTQTSAALSPALAVLLAPLCHLPLPVAGWLLALASLTALLLAMAVLAGPLARRHGRSRTTVVLALTALALLTGPVRATLGLGRPDLLLFGLVVADLVALRRTTWIHSRTAWSKRHPSWLRRHLGRLHPATRNDLGWSTPPEWSWSVTGSTTPGPATRGPMIPRSATRGLTTPRSAIRGSMTHGSVSSGSVPSGSVPSGSVTSGSMASGSVTSGSVTRWRGPGTVAPQRSRTLLHRLGLGWATGAWAGTGIGLAAAFSAAALLFIVYLLITRRRRAALTALVTAITVTLAVAVLAPSETLTWYGSTLWELDRTAPMGTPDNLSLAGVLARLYGFPAPPVLVWLSFGVLLLAVGLIRARAAHAECDEIAAFTLVGLTIAVAGPVTTPAEAIWLLPALLLLADAALHRKLGARVARPARFSGLGCASAAVFGYLILVAGPPWTIGWNAAALAVIVLLNTLPWHHTAPQTIRARKRTHGPAIPTPRGG